MPPLTAAHGAEILALGVTADGAAVASAGRLGGIRLWTTLDGTREPVVIQGTAPRSIALTRDGDGFAIATLDAAGGVHVIRTSAAGAVRDRVTVGDRPAVEIDSTSEGLLVLRADQTIELVDSAGAVRSRLTPDPGTHIDSIVMRGRHVLALVQEDKQLHGRWIVLDHGARWGASTPRFGIKFAHAVLSPDGDQLAVARPRSLHPALIDLATGKALSTALCVARGWPHEDGGAGDDSEFLRGNNAPVPLGFLSRTVVACSVVASLQWWSTRGVAEQVLVGSFAVGGLPVAMSDRALVVGMGPNLAIGSPTRSKFLGYGVHDVAQMRVAADGVLVSGPDNQSLVLDTGLRERARFDLGRARIEWNDAVLIDDRWAIVALPLRLSLSNEGVQIAVIDGVTRAQHQILPYDVRDRELCYEPTTRLLAASDGAASLILAFDPQTHTFGKPIRLASAITPSKIVMLDPGLAGGIAALAIDGTAEGLLVGELHHDDMVPGTLIQPRTSYRVPGQLRAVDRAGRLYTHASDDHDDVVIYTRGVAGARLPGVAALRLRPDADGSRIAAFEAPRLVMFTGAGTVRWDTSQWNSTDVAWLASGELVMQFQSAVAKVNLETGALADRRCGLAFGLFDAMPSAGRTGPTICEDSR